MRRIIGLVALALALVTSTSSLAGQTDQEKQQKQVKKIAKLHCLCTDTNNPHGVGTLAQFVGPGPGDTTYVGLYCQSPVFDASGAAAAAVQCQQFQVLPK